MVFSSLAHKKRNQTALSHCIISCYDVAVVRASCEWIKRLKRIVLRAAIKRNFSVIQSICSHRSVHKRLFRLVIYFKRRTIDTVRLNWKQQIYIDDDGCFFFFHSHLDSVVFISFLFGFLWFDVGSFVTENGKHALRMLSPIISQIDIAVVKLSHDVVSGIVSSACTYVDLILDIFVFFFFLSLCFTSFHFQRNLLDFIVFTLFLSFSRTHPQLVATQLFAICMFAKQFRLHCHSNITRRSFSM